MAYSDKVLDHYNNPRNVGSLDKSADNVGTGMVGAPECGDVMKLQIKVNDANGIIEDAKFKTFGCGSAIASSSLATEWLKGKTVDEALAIKNTDIVNELSLPPVKIHCSVLAEDAIKAAISDYATKQAKSVPPSKRWRQWPESELAAETAARDYRHAEGGREDPPDVREDGRRRADCVWACWAADAPGLSYQFKFDTKPRPTDNVFDFDGVQIFVDPKSILYLHGMTLDYKESLMQSGFVFENPNAKKSCGCGTSFSA